MIQSGFDFPAICIEGDIHNVSSKSWSNSSITSHSWVLYAADGVSVIWTSERAQDELPIIRLVEGEYLAYRYLEHTITNDKGETSTIKKKITVLEDRRYNPDDEAAPEIICQVPQVYSSTILANSPPEIILPDPTISSGSRYYPVSGSNFRIWFEDSATGLSYPLSFIRTAYGLKILRSGGSSVFYNFATGEKESETTYDLVRGFVSTERRGVSITSETEYTYVEGTGWLIDTVVLEGRTLPRESIRLEETEDKTRVHLTDWVYTNFLESVTLNVTLVRQVQREVQSILDNEEMSRIGTLVIQYLPGANLEKSWKIEGVSVKRLDGFERGSNYFLDGADGFHFRTRPPGDVFYS